VGWLRHLVSAALNPASTAATRWWCHSALRHWLTGYGPTARQRRFMKHGKPVIHHEGLGPAFPPSTEQMKARAKAIDDLLSGDDQ